MRRHHCSATWHTGGAYPLVGCLLIINAERFSRARIGNPSTAAGTVKIGDASRELKEMHSEDHEYRPQGSEREGLGRNHGGIITPCYRLPP